MPFNNKNRLDSMQLKYTYINIGNRLKHVCCLFKPIYQGFKSNTFIYFYHNFCSKPAVLTTTYKFYYIKITFLLNCCDKFVALAQIKSKYILFVW